MGRLQLTVDCTKCEYRIQSIGGTVYSDTGVDRKSIASSSKNSPNASADIRTNDELVLIVRAMSSSQRVFVECSVQGAHGLPVDTVRVKVEDLQQSRLHLMMNYSRCLPIICCTSLLRLQPVAILL